VKDKKKGTQLSAMAKTPNSIIPRGHGLAKDFMQALYGIEANGYLTLWTLEDKKTRWYKVSELDSLVNDAMDLRDSDNVYFGVGVRKEQLDEFQRGKSKDIASLPGVWVEIDIKGGVHAADNLPTQEDVQTILDTFPLEPSVINHSGGGLHCYWLFDKSVHIRTDKDLGSAERMLYRFQNMFIRLARVKGLHIDNTADLARVLRIPGTFNRKKEQKPVKTLVLNQEVRYSIEDLFEAIQSIETTLPTETIEKRAKREYGGEIPDATNADKIVKGCQFIRDYLDHKETANYNEWVAALSIASYCEDGENLVHEWSNGHQGYSEQVVDRKYKEIRDRMKPRSCQSINQDFGKCSGCKHFNKINSPIALGMERREPVKRKTPQKVQTFKNTDLGNAERLVHHKGDILKYDPISKNWFIWDGKRWLDDKKQKIKLISKDVVRLIHGEALKEEDADKRKAIAQHAIRSESRARLEAMISLAEAEVPVLPDEMDQDKWLFNCQNGVINLKNGELLPHDRKYLMNKISPVSYDSKADCPRWKQFLEDIMQDEEGNVKHELIEFLQKSIGYALTGDTSEQVLFFLYGIGKNGKSTFLDTIRHLLGDYAKQANTDSFTVKKSDAVRSDLAGLKGSRLVAATESEEGARLAESLVKQLTGGEPIQTRFLYGNFFEFVPEFKIFFTTNHKPIIRGSDEGIWRRMRLIPFTVTIPEEKRDKTLPTKFLEEEISGILRWAVEGCLKWQKEGLGNPKEVQEATDSYRDEMDTIGNFLKDYCNVNGDAKLYVSELYEKYCTWCEDGGEYTLSKQKINKKLEERGFKKKRDGNGIYFLGLRIKDLSNITSSYEKVYTSERNIGKSSSYKSDKKVSEKSFTSLHSTQKPEPEYI
jgi:P4 family phage/plasmid primase-like protien